MDRVSTDIFSVVLEYAQFPAEVTVLVLCSTPVQPLFNQRFKGSKPIRAKRELDAILECMDWC